MKITFKGKEIEVEEVCDGVVKKSSSVYYVRDNKTDEWLYSSKDRLDSLVKKYGSIEKVGKEYVGRTGKAELRKEAPPKEPKAEKAEKAPKKTSKKIEKDPMKELAATTA